MNGYVYRYIFPYIRKSSSFSSSFDLRFLCFGCHNCFPWSSCCCNNNVVTLRFIYCVVFNNIIRKRKGRQELKQRGRKGKEWRTKMNHLEGREEKKKRRHLLNKENKLNDSSSRFLTFDNWCYHTIRGDRTEGGIKLTLTVSIVKSDVVNGKSSVNRFSLEWDLQGTDIEWRKQRREINISKNVSPS